LLFLNYTKFVLVESILDKNQQQIKDNKNTHFKDKFGGEGEGWEYLLLCHVRCHGFEGWENIISRAKPANIFLTPTPSVKVGGEDGGKIDIKKMEEETVSI